MSDSGAPLRAVLINAEDQYGLFPVGAEMPGGWRSADFTGTEAECTGYVDEQWTDMRLLSLRHSL
ncbi:MbtH family NRPS accessory protein [Streptomyces sp. NPDC007861]|uniref:MbtH family NRPS accessory protein n=1 Tax=Streptomyces sp. NPDC007861 TaxID=3154893 RepID=UPI0033E7DAC6